VRWVTWAMGMGAGFDSGKAGGCAKVLKLIIFPKWYLCGAAINHFWVAYCTYYNAICGALESRGATFYLSDDLGVTQRTKRAVMASKTQMRRFPTLGRQRAGMNPPRPGCGIHWNMPTQRYALSYPESPREWDSVANGLNKPSCASLTRHADASIGIGIARAPAPQASQ
jgi:hypothetical protein